MGGMISIETDLTQASDPEADAFLAFSIKEELTWLSAHLR